LVQRNRQTRGAALAGGLIVLEDIAQFFFQLALGEYI
jgi:hypothetical protein